MHLFVFVKHCFIMYIFINMRLHNWNAYILNRYRLFKICMKVERGGWGTIDLGYYKSQLKSTPVICFIFLGRGYLLKISRENISFPLLLWVKSACVFQNSYLNCWIYYKQIKIPGCEYLLLSFFNSILTPSYFWLILHYVVELGY